MKRPSSKKKKMALIGLKCTIDHTLFRDVDDFKENNKGGFDRILNPKVFWRKRLIRKSKQGVIVGFGICFNGKIIDQGYDINTFKRSSTVKYVKILFDPDGQTYKVLPSGVHICV